MRGFRVFVSYAHEDLDFAERVVKALERLGIDILWDKHIGAGMPFTDAIKGLITHAHIFMPLITENSQQRPWVHQETGYAMALNVPVLPLAVATIPKEMIAELQAIGVKADYSDLDDRLQEIDFARVVSPPPSRPQSIIAVAEWPETRTEMMAQCAKRVVDLGYCGRLRQRGGLSSFCIPDQDLSHHLWEERDGVLRRGPYLRQLQREERKALDVHARKCGCDLVVDLSVEFRENGPKARIARLTPLLEFLESLPDDMVRIVSHPRAQEGSLTIVGDWFVAESMVPRPGEGYRQTLFSWHAPTALSWVHKFDQEFGDLYAESGMEPNASRKAAIAEIKAILKAEKQRLRKGRPGGTRSKKRG